jgi:hypothetical protein
LVGSHQVVILNVTPSTFVIPTVAKRSGGDLLYLPFNIGALTVFTIGAPVKNALGAAFPLRKAAHNGCKPGQVNCENGSAAQPIPLRGF